MYGSSMHSIVIKRSKVEMWYMLCTVSGGIDGHKGLPLGGNINTVVQSVLYCFSFRYLCPFHLLSCCCVCVCYSLYSLSRMYPSRSSLFFFRFECRELRDGVQLRTVRFVKWREGSVKKSVASGRHRDTKVRLQYCTSCRRSDWAVSLG